MNEQEAFVPCPECQGWGATDDFPLYFSLDPPRITVEMQPRVRTAHERRICELCQGSGQVEVVQV